jgi:hypothetical protein
MAHRHTPAHHASDPLDASRTPISFSILMMRLYWPSEKSPSIINGSWKIPPAKKVA